MKSADARRRRHRRSGSHSRARSMPLPRQPVEERLAVAVATPTRSTVENWVSRKCSTHLRPVALMATWRQAVGLDVAVDRRSSMVAHPTPRVNFSRFSTAASQRSLIVAADGEAVGGRDDGRLRAPTRSSPRKGGREARDHDGGGDDGARRRRRRRRTTSKADVGDGRADGRDGDARRGGAARRRRRRARGGRGPADGGGARPRLRWRPASAGSARPRPRRRRASARSTWRKRRRRWRR